MAQKSKPYVECPFTGESKTVEFLEAFFDRVSNPEVEGSGASILDTIFATTLPPQVPLYLTGAKDPRKRYIGRAYRLSGVKNPHEYLWCLKADISRACVLLPKQSRLILTLRYIRDWSEATIADHYRMSLQDVYDSIAASFRHIAATLDR